MTAGIVARRYARALLALAAERRQVEPYARQLEALAGAMERKELRDVLRNPSIPLERRRAVMVEIARRAGVDAMVLNFVQLLVDRHRAVILPEIARAFREMADEHAGRVRAEVTSARPLDPLTLSRLQKALQARVGKEVVLEQRQDPALLGGIVTRVGSVVYDGSLRTRLQNLRQRLSEARH